MDFNRLNYSLANEDSQLEFDAAPSGANHMVCIAGSGARALPLLAKSPAKLTLVDVAGAQLHFSELRVELLRRLSYPKFRAFLGYDDNMSASERLAIFTRLNLTPAARASLFETLHANHWSAPIYIGRWERGMRKMSRLIRLICGEHVTQPFTLNNVSDQLKHLSGRLGLWRWRIAIAILGHATALKALSYGGGHPKLNLARNNYRFYRSKLAKTWHSSLARENFFLQMLLLGRIEHSEGLPLEVDESNYAKMQQAARRTHIEYVHQDLTSYLNSVKDVDFVSASDIASYLCPEEANALYAAVAQSLSAQGLAVFRYYRHRPVTVPRQLIQDVTESYKQISEQEKTGVYEFGFYQKQSSAV